MDRAGNAAVTPSVAIPGGFFHFVWNAVADQNRSLSGFPNPGPTFRFSRARTNGRV
jgi:hypothetical protein